MLIQAPFLVPQAMETLRQLWAGVSLKFCGSFQLPCVLLLGSFNSSGPIQNVAFTYMACSLASTIVLAFMAAERWATRAFELQAEKLDRQLNPQTWSSLTLAAWDLRFQRESVDRERWREHYAAQVREQYDEDVASLKQRLVTGFARRLLACGLASLLLGAAPFASVASLCVQRRAIAEWAAAAFGRSGVIGQGSLVPNVLIVLLALGTPYLSKLIAMVAVKTPSARQRLSLWLTTLGRISASLPIVLSALEFARAGKATISSPTGGSWAFMQKDEEYRCPEDQAAAMLIALLYTDFVGCLLLRPVAVAVLASCRPLLLRRTFQQFEKPDFDIGDYAADVIHFKYLLCVAALLAPGLWILSAAVMVIHFKMLRVVLAYLVYRPFVADLASLLCAACQASLGAELLQLALAALLFRSAWPAEKEAECGPFGTDRTFEDFMRRVNDVPGAAYMSMAVNVIWNNVTMVVLIVALVACSRSMLLGNSVKAHHDALLELHRASQRQVGALRGNLERGRRQVDKLRTRLRWHEKYTAVSQ
eukprot:TRINITY_DN58922_c0_g2_i1.p1 TRINITY_DN58922_c0_g2~~TRINITY_DN58922_c0_g2_i1.p1  ORF type:complete len:534 (+),score=104.47 TRINITY_DN58922_c0_g2_i1:834-2435(+)